jgi:hypothetical protein
MPINIFTLSLFSLALSLSRYLPQSFDSRLLSSAAAGQKSIALISSDSRGAASSGDSVSANAVCRTTH